MTFFIRHLRLRAVTSEGVFGVDLPFLKGLNILSADNTTGKSTCMQAIIYVLGLERMLSPRREIPLAYVMRDYLLLDRDTTGPAVIESYVSMEVENSEGQALTIQRNVKGSKDWRLISTWNAQNLTNPSASGEQRDFFVRDPGSAQRELGFHTYLAHFMGWELPEVSTHDGNFVPLYMETIFPFLFVEQKVGWSAIQGPFPTYFRIQDVSRRVTEFMLDLDAQQVRVLRRELQLKLIDATQKWRAQRDAMVRMANGANARLQGLSADPTGEFGVEQNVSIQLYRNGEWINIDEILSDDRARLARFLEEGVSSTKDNSENLQRELGTLRSSLEELSVLRDTTFVELGRERPELSATELRIAALEDDRRKNRDAQKLADFGSDLGRVTEIGSCPTCHQSVDFELLPPGDGEAMTLDENIRYLESQLRLYRAMRQNARRRIDDLERQQRAINEEIRTARARIRTLRSALIAPDTAPSEAAIKERIELEAQIEKNEGLEILVSEGVQDLLVILRDYLDIQSKISSLPRDDFSENDKRKIERFQDLVREHLGDYGFRTFSPQEVLLSQDNFRPMVLIRRDDQDIEAELGFEMSASDSIRMKWAYFLSIFEIGREFRTNHPGFLILDEPRQQETDPISFDALIARAAKGAGSDRQIIFATSETPDDLASAIEGLSVNLIRSEGLLLKFLSEI